MRTLLRENPECVNVRDDDGRTPLHYPYKDTQHGEEIIELLIEHGADINAKDNEGRTPADQMLQNGRRGSGGGFASARRRLGMSGDDTESSHHTLCASERSRPEAVQAGFSRLALRGSKRMTRSSARFRLAVCDFTPPAKLPGDLERDVCFREPNSSYAGGIVDLPNPA